MFSNTDSNGMKDLSICLERLWNYIPTVICFLEDRSRLDHATTTIRIPQETTVNKTIIKAFENLFNQLDLRIANNNFTTTTITTTFFLFCILIFTYFY